MSGGKIVVKTVAEQDEDGTAVSEQKKTVEGGVLAWGFTPHKVVENAGKENERSRWPTQAEIQEQRIANKEKCRRQVLARVVWSEDEPGSPVVLSVNWEARALRDSYDVTIGAKVTLPGKARQEVEIRPIACVEIPYLIEQDGLWHSNGTDRCIILRPLKGKEDAPYTAVSLRLTREAIQRNIMAILEEQGRFGEMFVPLPNKIRTPGT